MHPPVPTIEQAPPKLAYSFVEGMCGQLGFGKTEAYEALKNGLVRTYVVGRKRFVSHEALVELIHKLERESERTGRGAA